MNNINNNTVLKNSLSLLVEKGISLPFNFITFLVMARYLGPQVFGEFNYGYSIVLLAMPLSKVIYETVIVRHLAVFGFNVKIITTSILYRAVGSLVICCFLFYLFKYTSFSKEENTFIVILTIIIFVESFGVFNSFFQYQLQSKYTVYSNSIGITIGSLMRIYLSINHPVLNLIAWTFVIEKVVTYVILGYLYFLKSHKTKVVQSEISVKTLFVDSIPLIITNLFIIINNRIDRLFIEWQLGTLELGYYTVSSRLNDILMILPTALMTSYFPMISKKAFEKIDTSDIIVQASIKLLFIALAIIIVVTLFSETIISTLFGQQYLESVEVLNIYIWCLLFTFIGHPISKKLIAENKTWINLFAKLSAAIINILLNYFLLPKYGLIGAAWASVISFSWGYYFYYYFLGSTRYIVFRITKEPIYKVFHFLKKMLKTKKNI